MPVENRPGKGGIRAASAARAAFRPEVFDVRVDDERAAMQALFGPGIEVVDPIDIQLKDLARSLHPSKHLLDDDLRAFIEAETGGGPLSEYGRWVYYPWDRRMVHVLPPDRFRAVRGDRNRSLISPEQAERLRRSCVGVVGMSAGLECAAVMALEGVGGSFRLADFERMELSHLNRVRTGVHTIGLNKAVLAARELFAIDPYLEIEVFEEGIHEANLESFLEQGGRRLDVLVEESDDLFIKVRVRERARALGIPVVTVMSFRGTVDVERFDLEPNRPLMHGLVGDVRAVELQVLKIEDKIPYLMSVMGHADISPELAGSLLEVDHTVSTWPQLASTVAVGGGLATSATRRVLLDLQRTSGRFDFHSRAVPLPEPLSARALAAPEAREERVHLDRPAPGQSGRIARGEIEYLVSYAAMAPSAGNAQPWDFVAGDDRIDCYLHEGRSTSFTNVDHLSSYVAIGAAIENLCLAAGSLGLSARVSPFPDAGAPLLVCRVSFGTTRLPAADGGHFAQIPRRATNRCRAPHAPLSPAVAMDLEIAARPARLTLVQERSKLAELGNLFGEADRVRFLSEPMHRDLMAEIRWTPAEATRFRTGIDLATLELSASEVMALRLLTPEVATFLRRLDRGGGNIRKAAIKDVAGSSAVAVLSDRPRGALGYFESGRCVERLWLEATRIGLAVHPLGTPFLFEINRRRAAHLTVAERDALTQLDAAWRHIVRIPEDHVSVLAFRITRAGEPSARSLRLPLRDILRFEPARP